MEKTLIDRYEAGAGILAGAVEGLSAEQLDAVPIANMWSIRQIIRHMHDSDPLGSFRMKLVLTEDEPVLPLYDHDSFARELFYTTLPVDTALDTFRTNRLTTTEILRRLPESAFDRVGLHPERGRMTLTDLVELYAWHVDHHLKFIRKKREAMGVPLEGGVV